MEFCFLNVLVYLHVRIACALAHPFRRLREAWEADGHADRNSITI